jgi:uncharacterized protein (DUF1697 family)
MQTLIALLRAVNVGGTGKLPMMELRAMAEAAGFTDVRTYIQSGNLVFSTAHAPSIPKAAPEKRPEAYAGKPVGVVIRTSQEMQAVLNANPFPNAEPARVGVLFLYVSPSPKTVETAKGQANEEIEHGEREIFVHYPSGMGRTKLQLAAMSQGTVRNINTVAKLSAMAVEASG